MKTITLNESQLYNLVKSSVRNILREAVNETPKCDAKLDKEGKQKARRERNGYDDERKLSWAYNDPEEARQRNHKMSRNLPQDNRMKGRKTGRGEFTGKLKRGTY